MEDGVLSPATMLGASNDLAMDFDYMDELLLEGCWLETTDGSEFLQQNPNISSGFFDAPYVWSNSENGNVDLIMNQSQESDREERQRSLFPGNLPVDETQGKSPCSSQSLSRNVISTAGCIDQSESSVIGGSEASRRWWIGPRANPGSGISVMERLIWALGYIKDFTRDTNSLIQLWVPVNRGGRCVLTTNNQPFSLDPSCPRLVGYRDISVTYQFPADKDSKELVGLPGRVFLGKVPEWTPDVRFFRSDEYSRVDDAQWYDVRGTLALPVFEQGSRTCLGVLEVVMTTQRVKYQTELESVCRALEAVDLRSSEPSDTVNVKECNMSYKAVFPEIQEVLRAACETHRLPLAQTWVPCIQQGKGGCRHSDENYARCVSTVDCACYVADPDFQGFHEACSEHHLLKGQGIVGGAFLTNQPCFGHDITSFCKTEYPLSHHARMFKLRAAVAIRLRSIYTSKADFVLEFFLPVDCVDPEEQRKMLGSLSTIIQQVCQSLRVVTDKELEEETDLPVSEVVTPSDSRPAREAMSKGQHNNLNTCSPEDSSYAPSLTEIQQCGNVVSPLPEEEPMAADKSSEFRQHNQDSSLEESPDFGEDHSIFGDFSSISKIGERRRKKAEKTITLQVLRQYFAGSLKDAAKDIGVCPTTLKRICRQHGIKRWPSRKIKKVGHSLQKLQLVIDSVQGTSGAMQIGSFYSNFPELASPNLSLSTSKWNDHPKQSGLQEVSNFSHPVIASISPSSSCSQSSSSSQFGSSGTQPHPSALNLENLVVEENSCGVLKKVEENSCGVLKKVRSDVELYASTKGPNLMTRSHSHKVLSNHPIGESFAPFPGNVGQEPREGSAQRVKVAYGDENIRFRMQSNWGFRDLLQEIGRRFSIDDTSRFDLKYLDDDSEWILLTCDADLEECMDVCRSCEGQTIKLSLQVSHLLGSSFGNSAP